jgi:hypothetical protein
MEQEILNFLIQYAELPIALLCFLVGRVIKLYITKLPNKFIPLILGCLGLVLNLVFNNFAFTFEIVITGIASGLAATGSFELVRNLIKKEK